MDGEDGFDVLACWAGENFGDRVRREVEGAGVDVCEEGTRSGAQDGAGRGEEAEGGGDDGVGTHP